MAQGQSLTVLDVENQVLILNKSSDGVLTRLLTNLKSPSTQHYFMSATNRGTVRQPQDLYPTPLESFLPLLPFIPDDGPVWEPAAGDFRLVKAMREYELDAGGTDLVPDGQDFLEDDTPRFCIVTNPPYSLAFEFCQHAVEHGKHVFLLLRLNFLASQRRKDWFSRHEPALFVLSKRPSFVNGGTDATDYAWYYWGPNWEGNRHL